ITEHIAIVPGDGKNGDALAAGLQRHDGPLLVGKRLDRSQEFQDIGLALSQRLTQLGRQRASRSVAPQLVSVRPDLNVAAAQLLKKGHHVHKANSSRSPAGPLVIGAFATHDSLSIISASPATVGRSKRLRSDRSTSN